MYSKLITSLVLFALLAGCSSSPALTRNRDSSDLAATGKSTASAATEQKISIIKGKYVTVPGTSLSFTLPTDFQPASGFVGYESLKHQASILILELPVPDGSQAISHLDEMYTADLLKTKGLELVSKETLTTSHQNQALLLKCSVAKDGITYTQWIYLLEGKGQKMGQIQVSAPEKQFKLIEEQITDMLSTFQWESKSLESETYYALDLPTDWKLAKQFGVMELYSKGGMFPIPEGEPSLGVTNLQQTVPAKKRQAYIEKMNLKRNYYTDLEVIDSKEVEIHGYPANISYVSGIETETSKPVVKQYCYIFLDQTVIFIEADQTKDLDESEFEKIATSWKLK